MTPPSHKDKWREEFDKEFEDFFSQETRVYSVDRFKSFIQATHTQLLNEIREWAEKQENKKDCSCTMDEGCGCEIGGYNDALADLLSELNQDKK